jgi:hypothetical protein
MTQREAIFKSFSIDSAKDAFSYEESTGNLLRAKSVSNSKSGDASGYLRKDGYIVVRFGGRQTLAHRIIWAIYYGELPSRFIDHVNGDRSDNRIVNLRLASRSENNQNATIRKDNKTGFKGVRWVERDKRFVASIRVNGKYKSLGYFIDAESASAAYQQKAKELHGEFHYEQR